MTLGLPGSGKSTWANKEVLGSGGNIKRVNKDDMRAMIDASKWSGNNEKHILAIRDLIIKYYLSKGMTVIVDDTNLDPKHVTTLKQIAKDLSVNFETKSFLDVPLETCIERDLNRDNSVGEAVIRTMYNRYIKPAPVRYKAPYGKPRAIMCDIDGTIAHMGERSPYDWHKVGTDNPDKTIIDLLRHYNDHVVILLSGRDSTCRQETVQWLSENRVPFHELYMRSEGDNRKDNIIKRELFDTYIRDNFVVDFVLDDRNQVVDMWRNELGLKVLQVAEGNF
jgi:predicted kinase